VIFLDAQCRQFNVHHFPYSIVTINTEKQICNGCEALSIKKQTDTYHGQMIDALLKRMEPRWDPSSDWLLFGDMKVMQGILLDLTGTDCCLLCGDMWHLVNEVWPHHSSFGRAAFKKIDNFLRLAVSCENEKEWDFLYQSARKVLADDPEKCSKLDAIHKNPSYFAGYVLNEIERLLGKQGDSHAE
jgi:hypothetical protein